MFRIGLAALVLALLPAPAMAQAGQLGCMESSYDAGQLAQFERLGPRARFGDGEDTTAADQMAEIALQAVIECAGQAGWSESQTMYAAYYELGRLNEEGFRKSGQLTAAELARLDAALITGDRDAMWRAVENGVLAGVDGVERQATREEEFALGSFAIGAGLGSDEATGELVGVLLGFIALQRVGAREFVALGSRK
jgi:hypothetical protein